MLEKPDLPDETIIAGLRASDYVLMLYPYIAGRSGMDIGLSESQWVELGTTLRRIHNTRLPAELAGQVRRESFAPHWAGIVQELHRRISAGAFAASLEDSFERQLSAFWNEKRDAIARIVHRTIELGCKLQQQPTDLVLCHTDIHTANVLLDQQGRMFIVDWDGPLLAPKERDLMFVAGGSKEALFFQGYGKVNINSVALAYYRYEWVVQELGDYGARVFVTNEVGAETKADAVRGFRQLFEPGDVVEAAYGSDREA